MFNKEREDINKKGNNFFYLSHLSLFRVVYTYLSLHWFFQHIKCHFIIRRDRKKVRDEVPDFVILFTFSWDLLTNCLLSFVLSYFCVVPLISFREDVPARLPRHPGDVRRQELLDQSNVEPQRWHCLPSYSILLSSLDLTITFIYYCL